MAAINPSNLGALVMLAWQTLLHFLTYPLRRRRGLSVIQRELGAHLVSPTERDEAPAALACVGCGKCDALHPQATSLILRLGREFDDAAHSTEAVLVLSPLADEITALCPYGVNVAALLRRAGRVSH